MGTFRKIVLAIVLVFSIFMLNIDRRYLFGWTEEEWDELEDWANENDIPYNEYSDADDFYVDNGYDDEDDYWNSQGYDDADDFWETNGTESENDIGDTDTSDPLDAEAVKQEIYSADATWYKNGDGSFSIDVDNDGVMDYLALVVGSYVYVNDINIELEEISIIYEPDVSSPNIDQEDNSDEDIVNDSENEENGDDDDEPLPIICDCCGECGHSYCSACEEEIVACNCDVCPDCGGCILEYGESLPEGCDFICIHCRNSFDFGCIESVRKVVEFRRIESILWTTTMFSYNVFLKFYDSHSIMDLLGELFDDLNFNVDYIEVFLTYYKGKLVEWSGDLQFICNDRVITNIYNDRSLYGDELNLTSDAKIEIYKVVSGSKTLVFHDYDKVYGTYISLSQINRYGIPKIGESVYKEFICPSL